LIGQPVFEKVKDIIKAKELKPIKVKGKRSKVMIYQVLNTE